MLRLNLPGGGHVDLLPELILNVEEVDNGCVVTYAFCQEQPIHEAVDVSYDRLKLDVEELDFREVMLKSEKRMLVQRHQIMVHRVTTEANLLVIRLLDKIVQLELKLENENEPH